ncbi:S41 family peptidase [Janthinobacterium sp. PAMC25594]|uniref:S41 family peptidase n=1 Tax=Janthinobacterium sp. PAMC25594 TaxID=2861284 RepID=UPI001C63266F|nr:S41 family peptidase [Janthinobacterium sp. PAMC25594]QYG06807.1 hypothetical protein KY494_26875 [Janthinobacterium sp. PAMC25594]
MNMGYSLENYRVIKLIDSRFILFIFSFFFCCPPAISAKSDLLDVARLWRDINYGHPNLAEDRRIWDVSLIDAIPKIAAADNLTSLESGIRSLMKPLSDPGVRVGSDLPDESDLVQRREKFKLIEWINPTTALINLHIGHPLSESEFEEALLNLRKSNNLIVDIRPSSYNEFSVDNLLIKLIEDLISKEIDIPAEQYRFSSGERPMVDNVQSGLYGGAITLDTRRIFPSAFARKKNVVFIVNDVGIIPKALIAMQKRGKAVVIAEFDKNFPRADPVATSYIGPVRVEYSSGRLVDREGVISFKPDIILKKNRDAGKSSVSVKIALRYFGKIPSPYKSRGGQLFPIGTERSKYLAAPYPSIEIRQLAAIKLWADIDQYSPTRESLGISWDEALIQCLNEMEMVNSELDYGIALQKMTAKIGDSHVRVWSKALNKYWGQGDLGVQLRFIENSAIVTGLDNASSEEKSLFQIGDEILEVNGIKVESQLKRILPLVSGSTNERRIFDALGKMLKGSVNDNLKITIKRGVEKRQIDLSRREVKDTSNSVKSSPSTVRFLSETVAYVDLAKLEKRDVDSMFSNIEKSDGVIFDLRGYPLGTAWEIAPRLNVRDTYGGPNILQNFITAYSGVEKLKIGYTQSIKRTDKSIYQGKVVVLIDEGTISQAEQSALMFEAANPVTFVGSRSAGTNGDIRHIVLPGSVTVSFSGFEVRHADGRQLQRVGVQPSIIIKPTINGIRSGRDEVLEGGVRFLQTRQ